MRGRQRGACADRVWEIDQRVNQRLFAESRGSREREDAGTGTSIGKFVARFFSGVIAVRLQVPAGLFAKAELEHVVNGQELGRGLFLALLLVL